MRYDGGWGVTARVWRGGPQAPAVSTLLPSLVKTVEPDFDYRVYLGYDVRTPPPPPPTHD